MSLPIPPQRLEQRLEDAARAWLLTNPTLGQYCIKERDEDTMLLPEGAIPKPIIILVAKDDGRAYRLTPIRNLRLSIIVRANAKCPGGDARSFSALGGTLEILLDTSNLVQALSSLSIGVMLVTRNPGIGFRETKLVREGRIELECKAVAAECTVQGTGLISYV